MADRIVCMHHIPIIPETIPFVLFYCFLIEADISIQPVFHPGTERSTTIGKTPNTKCLLGMQIVRYRHQHSRSGKLFSLFCKSFLSAITALRYQGKSRCTGNPVRSAHSLLHIFVTGIQVMGHIIIMAQVHRLSIRTPYPCGKSSHRSFCIRDFNRRRIRLPEIMQLKPHASGYISGKGITLTTCTGKSTYPRIIVIGTFTD